MKRNFAEWMLTFTDSIADYKYYIDFETIYKNANKYKVELNIMNSLVGSKDIEKEFIELVKKYPEILKCIPILLAVRQSEIKVLDYILKPQMVYITGHYEFEIFLNQNYEFLFPIVELLLNFDILPNQKKFYSYNKQLNHELLVYS